MEAAVKKLEASYRGQMKEWVEMLRERVEGGAAREAKLTAKLSSEMQERLKAERTKLEERLRQGSGRRAREELVQVWHGIRRVLEREGGMMRGQVGRATGQVREWAVREQRRQVLQQARQLHEEAERFGSKGGAGGVGGDGGDGRGGAATGGGEEGCGGGGRGR